MASMNNDISLNPETGKQKSTLKTAALFFLFLFLVFFFTMTKLPQTKMTSLIQGYLQVALDPFGIYITDRGRDFSIWRGLEYTLTQPTLELSDQTQVELDEMKVSPRFLSLLKGQLGGSISIKQGAAHIDANGGGRGGNIDTHFNLDQVDIGKFGLLSFAGGLKGSGLISGTGNIEGSLTDLTTLNGTIQLKLKKLHLDEQTIMSFQLPALNISEGTIDLVIERGKIAMKNLQIGKALDDLQIALTGDITLSRNINSSPLNLRAVLGVSDKLKASIPLIDSIMGTARQADGKYAYKLTGALNSPFPMPDTAAK